MEHLQHPIGASASERRLPVRRPLPPVSGAHKPVTTASALAEPPRPYGLPPPEIIDEHLVALRSATHEPRRPPHRHPDEAPAVHVPPVRPHLPPLLPLPQPVAPVRPRRHHSPSTGEPYISHRSSMASEHRHRPPFSAFISISLCTRSGILMATTLFIAVQCCQCSTMQVKQQKKSSNKWVCAVCNQRQSLRRVHASGPLARDVRLFVQTFNISRSELGSDVLDRASAPRSDDARGPSSPEFKRKRRTDWSEYLDLGNDCKEEGEDEEEDTNGGVLFEPKIVTELPLEKFKRLVPKGPRCVHGAPAVPAEENVLLNNWMSPVARRKQTAQSTRIERQIDHAQVSENEGRIPVNRWRSKWSEYLEDSEDDERNPSSNISDPFEGHDDWTGGSSCALKNLDENVGEEEVHPDFKYLSGRI